jgi:predicted AAA+ superfamily ATPase
MAGLVIPVTHTSANGIPLGAEADDRKRKLILLDTGLFQRVLGLNVGALMAQSDFDAINKGAIAEIFVGLEWLKYGSPLQNENLYYWHRESANANAEIDYVIQQNEHILPIEIKASNKGAMQSMFQFLKEKNKALGVRFSLENFSEYPPILVYPLYAVSNLREGFENKNHRFTV